jgi:hypothetical protein
MSESIRETVTVQIQIYKDRFSDVVPELGKLAGSGIIEPNTIQFLGDDVDFFEYRKMIYQLSDFNPRLVDYIPDDIERKNVAVITEEKLTEYALEFDLADKANCSRLMTALFVYAKGDSKEARRYMYDDKKARRYSIRADMLSELNYKIQKGKIKGIPYFGVRLKKLLSDIELELLFFDPEQNR